MTRGIKRGFERELEKYGFVKKSITRDGNCLYRCFSHWKWNTQDQHAIMRKCIHDYMAKEEEYFKAYTTNFKKEQRARKQDGGWGNHMDLVAMARIEKVQIIVYEYNSSRRQLFEKYRCPETAERSPPYTTPNPKRHFKRKTVLLLFRDPTRGIEHYERLLPQNVPTKRRSESIRKRPFSESAIGGSASRRSRKRGSRKSLGNI